MALMQRLRRARHERFVGRLTECRLFQQALLNSNGAVFHISGPGGVGKTTLLGEFLYLCEQAQVAAHYLDARNLEPQPESFLSSLRVKLGLGAADELGSYWQQGRQVLLIDTYERLGPLDDWLREVFLPQLPEPTLVVLAGRHPPRDPWRTDPGWQGLLQPIALRNLSPDESYSYLTQRAVPTDQHPGVLAFTHGHPLALSLVADVVAQGQAVATSAVSDPDVVRILLEKFLQEVPSPVHRLALEACALVRLTTEAVLAHLLDGEAHGLFGWLRSLSFIESDPQGLFPHDLARAVLVADLRWRNPDGYAQLHQRARAYYSTRLGQTQGQEQHRLLFDYLFLHHENSAVRPRFTWQQDRSLRTDDLQPGDLSGLLAMVTQHEGADSARLCQHWLSLQPQGVRVYRGLTEERPLGFLLLVNLQFTQPQQRSVDPLVQTCWEFLEENAPLRAGEGATLLRFWMAHDSYQEVSAIQSLVFINFIQHHQSTPGLAFSFLACSQPEFWADIFAYADYQRLPLQQGTTGVYGHDWRVISPKQWQELLAQRELDASVPRTEVTTLVLLSEPEFCSAVQAVLKQFTQAHLLQHNPLVHSRLLAAYPLPERVAALQQLIYSSAESLQASPKEAKGYRALYHTYLQPLGSQEQVADHLDIPFSSYRRHLKQGIDQITQILWQQEIN